MKILLATDGSEYSEGAAKLLTRLNLSSEDEIIVFHAIYWIPFRYDQEFYCGTLNEIRREIAPRIIDSALRILQPVKAKISTAITECGAPGECIIDAAVNSDTDMVVMGARGIRGIESFFVGSVTREVSIKSPKPVLITKLPVHEKPEELKVLFATDGSDYSCDTAEFLSTIPFYDNAEIRILNVMPPEILDIPQTFAPEIIEKIIEIEDKVRETRVAESGRILEDARDFLGKRFSNIDIVSSVGTPSREILKTAETLEANLIAVGCRGLRGIKGMMGSVSRDILSHSRCSVLIGKTCKVATKDRAKMS